MVMFHSYVIEIVSFPIKNGDLVILTIVFCKRLPEANDVDFFVWDTEKKQSERVLTTYFLFISH